MANQGGHSSGPAHSHHHGHGHGGHATHAQVLANHMNQHVLLSAEVTKFLKQNTNAPKALPYRSDRIRQRTSTTCVPDTADEWNEQHSRRQSHLSKGFFTPQQCKYELIGEVELDSRSLVYKVFSDCLPKKIQAAAFFSGSRKLGFTPPKTAETSDEASKPYTHKEGEIQASGRTSQLNEAGITTAGYNYIKDYLKESETILVAERGGQTFDKCVLHLENAKKQSQSLGTQRTTITFRPPAGMPQGGGGNLARTSSQYSQARAASVMSTDSMRSDVSTRTTSKTKPIDDEVEEELLRLNFLRTHRAVAEKLKAIHRILNALHNMKTKDLRTRVPLSHDMVKFLYRHVPYERPVFSRLARTTGQPPAPTAGPMELIQSSDTVSSTDFNSASLSLPGPPSIVTTMSKWTSKSHLSNKSTASVKPGDTTVPLSQSTTPIQWRKFRQNLPALHLKSRPSDKEHRLETWEDLLAVPASSTMPSGSQQIPRYSLIGQGQGPANPQAGFSKWMTSHLRHHPERDHLHPHPPAARQPYWMTAAVSSADKTKWQAQATGQSSPTVTFNPEKTLENLKENFLRVQKKMAREALTDIERMERERCRTFRQKFHAANEHPVMELAVKYMRETPQISRQLAVVEDTDMKEIKPSKWYIDLKQEVESRVGKDDPSISAILQKLARWSLEDAKSIPNAKEKLCLLVMSMPARELLTIEMQQAIQFVLEHILWASQSCFSQWLIHRKIPVITGTTLTVH